MDRNERVQVLGREGTLATFISNLSQSYHTTNVTSLYNPGTLGIDKASSVKACILLTTAVCSCTQGYMRNKRTFHYDLFTLTRQEQRHTDSIVVSRRSLITRIQLSMLVCIHY